MPRLGRRRFLAASALAGAVPLVVAACARREDQPKPPADAKLVRVVSVSTPVDGELLPELLAEFQKASSYTTRLVVGAEEVYDIARRGEADVVISHYGHKHAEEFVVDGLGRWPRTLFSNQLALLGPPADPAGVRGLTDVVEAFKRIASARAPFIVNDLDGIGYLTDILWHAAGQPPRDPSWFITAEATRVEATELAEKRGGYTFWGLTPFLREQKAQPRALEPLVVGDPLLQRLMVSIVVEPKRIAGVNVSGAEALESFLLEPSTQARIRRSHYPGVPAAVWAPAGRHNRTAVLPKGKG